MSRNILYDMNMNMIPFLGFSEPISSLLHLITALFMLVYGIRMIWRSKGNRLRTLSLCAYVFCTVFLFSMSGVYHLLEKGTTSNYVLRILDHAGIYLMIAGSFTPFQIILLRGYKRWILLSLIWILAITGVSLTSVFFDSMPEWLLLSFFITMGWMSIFTVLFIRKVDPKTTLYIFWGGILYTMGAGLDFLRWPNILPQILEAHEVFHIFISAAAITHLIGVNRISQMPISHKLTVHIKKTPHKMKAYITTEKAVFEASSEEQVKGLIKDWITKNFPKALRPKRVKVKYFEEDHITLK